MKIAIILFFALAIAAFVVFGVPAIKRKKLAEAWSGVAKQSGIDLPEAKILTELKKLPNADVDTLIDFSKKLQAKKIGQVIVMLKQVRPILDKTSLGDIDTYLTGLLSKK